MKTFLALVSASIALVSAACATEHAIADLPAASVPSSGAAAREPGRMVLRRDLVLVGSADLLDPVRVPAVPTAEVPRTPGVATLAASGCESGPGAVHVVNGTEFPLSLTVDGEPVATLGVGEIRRFIAPRSTVYLCLDASRSHAFEGFALKRVDDRLYAIPRDFRADVAVDTAGPVTYTVTYRDIVAGR